jgi:hypothetical protein
MTGAAGVAGIAVARDELLGGVINEYVTLLARLPQPSLAVKSGPKSVPL